MKFLRDKFIAQLRAEVDSTTGNVVIEAASFTPQQILEFNNDTFELAFKEWCETQKENYLEKANKILKYYENHLRFSALKQIYKKKNIIPFIGAGLSIPSGYESWTQLLYSMHKETHINEDDLTEWLQKGEYENAAQKLHDAMPNGRFEEYLSNRFDRSIEYKDISGCIRYLPFCFDTSIVTTNFDDVLKKCFDEANKSFDDIIYGVHASDVSQKIQGKRILIKLHGRATSVRERILTETEYNKHYKKNNKLIDCITKLSSDTFLFLGCSLTIDKTIQELCALKAKNRLLLNHYAFLMLENEAQRIDRQNELAKANIFPIWYPADEDHDECIMALLTKLKEEDV